MSRHSRAAVRAEGLRKLFGRVAAVEGIDLAVDEGEIFALLGPNGAGKSTTIRMLTTLLRPTAGRAWVAGFDVATQARHIRRHIGVALQEAGLDELATGTELLVLQAELYGVVGREARKRAATTLDLVGLSDVGQRQVKTYSGGMKRRLDLASALINHPRVLFLDEPTAGLDPASREVVWDEIRRLNHEHGITVILTTHYLEEADRLARRLAIIDHGRIVAQGTPDELKGSIGSDVVTVAVAAEDLAHARRALSTLDGLLQVRDDERGLTLFVDDGTAAVVNIVRLLDDALIPVGSVALSRPTLDEVFLRTTGFRIKHASTNQEVAA